MLIICVQKCVPLQYIIDKLLITLILGVLGLGPKTNSVF